MCCCLKHKYTANKNINKDTKSECCCLKHKYTANKNINKYTNTHITTDVDSISVDSIVSNCSKSTKNDYVTYARSLIEESSRV